jgi:thymidylate synthase
MFHFAARNASEALPVLIEHIFNEGEEVGSRLGERVRELRHVAIQLNDPVAREILTPGRRASLPAQIAETMWILAGRNDIGWLSHYLPRAADFSDDGETWRGGYGPRLRRWNNQLDQLAGVVELLKTDPTSRRAVIAIYDPATDSDGGKDVPCNDFLIFSNRNGQLDLQITIRSNDLWWGWTGINAFEWGVMLEVVAHLVGVAPGSLHFATANLHLYDRHWKRAQDLLSSLATDYADSELTSVPFAPSTRIDLRTFDLLLKEWFRLEEQLRNGDDTVEKRLCDPVVTSTTRRRVELFPEPLLRAWLKVLGYHWSGDDSWLEGLEGTRIKAAALASPRRKPARDDDPVHPQEDDDLAPRPGETSTAWLSRLHRTKGAVYGNSWKKRGELFSILPNIARKVDRLGAAGAGDTELDTRADLLVYLLKYQGWLHSDVSLEHDEYKEFDARLKRVRNLGYVFSSDGQQFAFVRKEFDALLCAAEARADEHTKSQYVDKLLAQALSLFQREWARRVS